MANLKKTLFLAALGLLVQLFGVSAGISDKSCWTVYLNHNRSSVCMCTADYCDEVIREEPAFGTFVTYKTTEDGQRFKKNVSNLETFYYNLPDRSCPAPLPCLPALYLDATKLYQTIEGFGGAVTDAAGINWDSLHDERLKQNLIDSYFSKRGLQYNMIRVPIGGSDFSTRIYAYNESPINDPDLSNFTLSFEDFEYKLPMIKRALDVATDDVHVLASTWSPPAWMKTSGEMTGRSELKKEYYQTYAEYHLRFIKEYAKEGVPVWGITTTNEPTNAVIDTVITFNSLGWLVTPQGEWIANNLGPTIRNSSFSDVKIITVDDQRPFVAYYFNMLTTYVPEALKYIDGVGVHFYLNSLSPPETLSYALRDHPDVFILSTEACAGAYPSDSPKVDLGSWERAELYIKNIIEDLNYNSTGWIDWNMCLNKEGGPNWNENFVDSPIIVAADKQVFYKQPMWYALGHAAKFLPRGSRRIQVDQLCQNSVDHVAFLTPDNTVVTLLHNDGEATDVHLVTCNRIAVVHMEKNSIATVELVNEYCH